jgi:hypothetical protein
MRVPGPLSLPVDLQRALGALAILPEIGLHIQRMARDVRLMREGVERLPPEVEALRAEVVTLHQDMDRMRADVAELRALEEHITGLRADLSQLPFLGRRAARAAARDAR